MRSVSTLLFSIVGWLRRRAATKTARPISTTRTGATTMLVIIRTVFRVRDIAIVFPTFYLGNWPVVIRGVITQTGRKRFRERQRERGEKGEKGKRGRGEKGKRGTGEQGK